MKKQSSLRSFLFNVYGYSFFNSLVFMYPIYMLFFSKSGVSDVGVSVLLIIWSLCVVAAQIPVLAASNRISKKLIMIIAVLLKAACFGAWILWPTFWGFAFGFLLWGIHWAAYNVVWEALVYDELQARRYRSIYAKVCGHKTAIECVALILACTGSLMIPLGYDFVAHVTIASVALSALFLARMKIRSRLQVKRKANAVKSLRLAGTVMKRVPYVFYLLVLVTLVYAVSQIDEYLGLIGVEVGVRPELVGGLFVISLLCQTFGNSVADRFEWLPDKKLFAGVVVIGLMLILLSIFYSVPGLVFLGLFCFVYAIVRVLVYSRFQHALPPASRSAFLSAYSFCEQATCILSYMVMMAGVMMGGGYRLSILLTGLISVLIGLWAMAYIPQKKKLYDRLASYRLGASRAL